jgi:hypothetical protein
LTIYKPSTDLLEEILDERTIYSGISGFFIWNSIATALAPWVLVLLLRNDNQNIIESMAVNRANSIIDEDE